VSLFVRGKSDDVPLAFRPLSSIIQNAPLEPAWLWSGYLAPGSLTLIAGAPKVGKSTLVFALLSAIERGEPFLGRATRAGGAVLLSEERQDGLAEKTRRFALGAAMHALPRHEGRQTPWVDQIAGAVAYAKREGLSLLVVDTFAELAGLQGDDENDAGAVLEALRPLHEAADAGLAVLIVTHQRKSGGSHGAAVRGSNALTGAVDVIVELERGKGSVRWLKASSRFNATPSRLVLSLDGDTYVVEARRADEERKALLDAVTALGDSTGGQLVEATGLPKTAVYRLLKVLHDAEEIYPSGQGRKGDPRLWHVTEAAA
jgi:hypothetical protein